ncbi:autophagy-related protein 17 [Lipomyces japonicus]|uniref:autophagy-related protein 17 n=1 Tax=Lipomyces japonicus TaxID=56871 RepID=UPI0034CEF08C
MDSRWFVAAKKALALAQPWCADAADVAANARLALEAGIAATAVGSFAFAQARAQVGLLVSASACLHDAHEASAADFQRSLRALDASGASLDAVLDTLGRTAVDPALAVDPGSPRTLKDLTDATVVDDLKAQLRRAIDRFTQAHLSHAADLVALDTELDELSTQANELDTNRDVSNKADNFDPVAEACGQQVAVEDHAHAMGDLLESLAHHYDQCSQALVGSRADLGDHVANTHDSGIIQVLHDDAGQVDGVVSEIRERFDHIRFAHDAIHDFLLAATDRYDLAVIVLRSVSTFQPVLDDHLYRAHKFADAVADYFVRRDALLDELDSLVDYFARFAHAYDALVLEIVRRVNSQARMDRVVQDALDKLKFIHDEELNARHTFYAKNGDFLPSDLWPGLADPPVGYEIIAHEAASLPELSKSTIELAKKRFMNNI